MSSPKSSPSSLMTTAARERLAKIQALRPPAPPWRPLPGPQTQALESKADVLLFGGAAGGGKTDLLLGCARLNHSRSIIFRRVYPSLRAIVDRSRGLYNPDAASAARDSYNEGLHRWRFADGRSISFGSIQHEKDRLDYQGQAHDFYGFDEITEFSKSIFEYVTAWNRSTVPGQRCRIICTGNPPTTAEGEWVLEYWSPWLDPDHARPARPGELRWYTTNEDGVSREVPEGTPGAVSRTFIPSRVQDNPYLMAAGYEARLRALPEPLRSKLLNGDFRAGRKDDDWQVIPSAWVRAAQARWRERARPSGPPDVVGLDVARGGADQTVATPRWGNYFGSQETRPGEDTPDGRKVVMFVLPMLGPSTVVQIDAIGVGASPYDLLRAPPEEGGIGHRAVPMIASSATEARDRSNQLRFFNARSEWHWKLREALDPESGQDLAIPDDPRLRADLCAPRWEATPRGIKVESKDEVKARLGRSPDHGDSLLLAASSPFIPGIGLFQWLEEQAAKPPAEEAQAQEGQPRRETWRRR